MTIEEKAAHDALIIELKSVITEENAKSNTIIAELKSKIEVLETKSNGIKSEDFEEVKKEAIRLATEVKALQEKPIDKKAVATNFKQALNEAFEAKAAEIKSIVDKGGKQTEPLFIEVKTVVDMSVTNTIAAGSTQVSITDNTGIISPIRQRTEKYLAAVSVGATAGNRAMWIEETTQAGTPIFIAEAAGKTALSVLYVEQTALVKKIAVYGKVTTEMLADLPQLISYIQNNLMKRLGVVVENQLLTGGGTGDDLTGVKTVATAFSAGASANAIPFANEFDVINAIGTQIELAYGIPNAIFIHPSTIQAMKAVKSSIGEPLWKTYTDFMGDMVINGMKVISTPAVTAGEFIGGDLKAAQVLFREQLNIQIGLDGNDFINNKKTILVEQRLVQFVSANDTPVIIKGDFATAKAALLLV